MTFRTTKKISKNRKLLKTVIVVLLLAAYLGLSYKINSDYPKTPISPNLTYAMRQAFAFPGVLAISAIFQPSMPIIIVFSIDGDLSTQMPDQWNEKSIQKTFELLDQAQLKGKVTWFINQGDYNWAEKYQWALKEIISRGDELALHSHFLDHRIRNNNRPEKLEIKNELKKAKVALEEVVRNNYSIKGFRSGALAQTEEQFDALDELGFLYDSSYMPGVKYKLGKYTLFDNTGDRYINYNWTKIRPGLLEFPLYRTTPGITYVNIAMNSKAKPTIISHLLFHPYELLNEDGNINKLRYYYIKFAVWAIRHLYHNVTFMTGLEAASNLTSPPIFVPPLEGDFSKPTVEQN